MPSHPRLCAPLLLFLFTACLTTPTLTPTPNPNSDPINLDSETQTLIADAERVAFLIPFSHWDTDWHENFASYSKRSDGNIAAAIELAKQDSRFRYTFEQVLFVQHFWDTVPVTHEDLKHFVQNRQFTFAWAGITQPETSLVAPATQVRNLQLGQQWIANTFGSDFVPSTAWQSDAFGNSAAFPLFLNSQDIQQLFIGRWQNRCDPDFQDCTPLPHAFYWQSPVSESKVLVTYSSYPSAWDAIHRLATQDEQVTALGDYLNKQFERTDSKFVFIPMGSDFIDPLPNVVSLVDQWNANNTQTKLVIADPATAFDYIESQTLPTLTVDLNPIWQAFYATRPFAKIADKESDYYLTANDKFSTVLNTPASAAWQLAASNAHYDNIGAVSFDQVWNDTQRPRFEQTLQTSADDLANTLAAIAARIDSPLIIFNPTSWDRHEVIEIANSFNQSELPVGQPLTETSQAILVEAVPGIGWTTVLPNSQSPTQPVTISQSGSLTTLVNGFVSVTLDSSRGGALTNLQSLNSPNLLNAPSDNLTFWRDTGDVYGARFGQVLARQSDSSAQIEVLASGPLLARVRVTFTLNNQPVTKLITLRADSPLVEVESTFAVTPNTSAILHTHTNLNTLNRTDDLGFTAFTHELDNTPITDGDITYRRKIFYPITFFSDVIDESGNGLALITHGLQALGGTSDLNLLLLRDAREDEEGVADADPQTFHYAYLPHVGQIDNLPNLAYAFNQPLIPVLKVGDQIEVQLPFTNSRTILQSSHSPSLPLSYTLLTSHSALVLDLYTVGDQLNALVVDYALDDSPATISVGDQTLSLPARSLFTFPIPTQ
jgi:hypothetical protein